MAFAAVQLHRVRSGPRDAGRYPASPDSPRHPPRRDRSRASPVPIAAQRVRTASRGRAHDVNYGCRIAHPSASADELAAGGRGFGKEAYADASERDGASAQRRTDTCVCRHRGARRRIAAAGARTPQRAARAHRDAAPRPRTSDAAVQCRRESAGILKVRDLSVSYGTQKAVDGVSFEIAGARSSDYSARTARARPAR